MVVRFADEPEQARAFYEENGYFVEQNVFSKDLCEKLILAAQKLPAAVSRKYGPAMQPHREDPVFEKALNERHIVNVMNTILGGRVDGLQTEFFYSQAGVKGFAAHQDNYFVEADDETFGSAWVALTDVGPENGGLYGYPGSHKLGRLPVRRLAIGSVPGQDPNANNEETVMPEGYSVIDIVAPRGSVVFLHAYFVHGSHPNLSNDFRYALLFTYLRQGARFRPGAYAQRAPIPLTCEQQ